MQISPPQPPERSALCQESWGREAVVGKVPVGAAGERHGGGGKISPDQADALCGYERIFDGGVKTWDQS